MKTHIFVNFVEKFCTIMPSKNQSNEKNQRKNWDNDHL